MFFKEWFCVLWSIFGLECGPTSPTVHIKGSEIVGQQISFSENEVNQYLGIPYAQPPIGPLRFRKPLPIQNYPSEFQAINQIPPCPQYAEDVNNADTMEKSEDCLQLNIWTPTDASPTNKKAVLLWIHGGSFRYGSAKDYNGTALSLLGDIIVVTVNYRLGPFGFFTSDTEDAPPNVGLWDILEALKWVNQYISAFGGDPDRITISGVSAGGYTPELFSMSPQTEGLYARMIMGSSSPIALPTNVNTDNVALAQKFANIVKCANDTYAIADHPKEVVQCLRGVDADTLSRADNELGTNATGTFLPQWGDDFIPEHPWFAVEKGNFKCKDLMIGNTKDEGAYVLPGLDPELFGAFGEKNVTINITMGQEFMMKLISTLPDPQSVLQYYLPDNFTESVPNEIRHQLYTGLGDIFSICPDVYYAEKCAEQKEDVYFYLFAPHPTFLPYAEWMGAPHYVDVPYVFGLPLLDSNITDETDIQLSRQMIELWGNFAKDGKPNFSWPLYSKENPTFKYLGPKDINGQNGVGPHLENCNFLRSKF